MEWSSLIKKVVIVIIFTIGMNIFWTVKLTNLKEYDWTVEQGFREDIEKQKSGEVGTAIEKGIVAVFGWMKLKLFVSILVGFAVEGLVELFCPSDGFSELGRGLIGLVFSITAIASLFIIAAIWLALVAAIFWILLYTVLFIPVLIGDTIACIVS
ncbi:MAG: hypothetical protein IKP88_02410 [Lachnospiraceae bacterium]|nr:hypothetical protein [Lachnospiraceae bacterium]